MNIFIAGYLMKVKCLNLKCKRCGRKLTDPISKQRGYGAVCFRKISVEEMFDSLNQKIDDVIYKINNMDFEQSREAKPSGVPKRLPNTNPKVPKNSNHGAVIAELKGIINSVEDIRSILKPITN